MKRSPFKPKPDWKPLKASKPMAKGTSKLKPVGARAKRMRQGRVAPTAEESAWMTDAVSCGCVVCATQGYGFVLAEIHHLKSGDRRMGHMFSIPLCEKHHRGGAGDGQFISRHPFKKRFETAYGTEMELLELTKGYVAVLRAGRAINRLKVLSTKTAINA
jgi:hypothetical protein